LSGGTGENHEQPQSGSRSLGRDLNPGPPEYESGILTSQLRRLVTLCSVQDRGNFDIRYKFLLIQQKPIVTYAKVTDKQGQFKKKVTLSHVCNEVTRVPTITRYITIVEKTLKVCL
jgi:hypothetical protein